MSRKKFFVVVEGKKPGIYKEYQDFLAQKPTKGKGFSTLAEAKKYLKNPSDQEKKKYYAVAEGIHTGIYESHKKFSAQKPVKGRSFTTRKEAEDYLERNGIRMQTSEKQTASTSEAKVSDLFKYFVVIQGLHPGIYKTAEEYQAQYPIKGDSFDTLKEAEDYLDKNQFEVRCTKGAYNGKSTVVAYTDGSFNEITKTAGIAGVLLYGNEKKHVFAEAINNVAENGPLFAEMQAIATVFEQVGKKHNIVIRTDCDACIDILNSKAKKATLEYFEQFIAQYKKLSKKTRIIFEKVKGHSGIEDNEFVNSLAKIAAGNKLLPKEDSYISKYISQSGRLSI